MAANTVTVWETALKQVWSQDEMERQFVQQDDLLKELEVKKSEAQIGGELLTPVYLGHGGGYTAVGAEGSSELNSPESEQINRAKWKEARHYVTIELDTASVKQSESSAKAVASSVNMEMSGKLEYLRRQLTRQLFGEGNALIAQCAKEESESTTVKLLKTGLGNHAIANGWLVKGQEVDIGTKAEQKVVVGKSKITAVKESETEPTITISSKVKTAETNFVSIANARSGETSNEAISLRQMTDSESTLGGIKPETVPQWAGVTEKQSSNPISRQMLTAFRRKLRKKGNDPDWSITSLEQIENIENILFPQIRYNSPSELNTGDGTNAKMGNLSFTGHLDCPKADLYMLRKEHLSLLRDEKPQWMPEKYEGGKVLRWKQNTTFLTSALEYFLQTITNRRNALGRLSELA